MTETAQPASPRPAKSRRSKVIWEDWSLTSKLVTIMMTLMLLAMTGTSAWALENLRQSLVERTDERLIQASEALALQAAEQVLQPPALRSTSSTAESSFRNLLPGQYYVQFYALDGSPRYAPVAADDSSQPYLPDVDVALVDHYSGAPFTVEGTDSRWRVRALEVANTEYTVAIALPLDDDVDGITERSRNTMIGIGLIALGLAGAVGWLAITNTFRPLREIEKTAARIAAGDLSQRVPSYPTDTELGRLSASLNTMLGKIETSFDGQTRSEKRMRQFVSDASHELRTPLVTIRGYAELYRQGAIGKPEDVGAAMLRIENEARRMGALVDDLVALARMDERHEKPQGAVDISQIVSDAAADAAAQAPDRDIALIALDGGDAASLPRVYGSESQIRQVIVNLAGNAVRHTSPGSPIEFAVGTIGQALDIENGEIAADGKKSATAAGRRNGGSGRKWVPSLRTAKNGDTLGRSTAELRLGESTARADQPAIRPDVTSRPMTLPTGDQKVVIEIRDHGDGIDEEDAAKIFERFYRLDVSRNRDTGGSGLGLSIVKAIVTAHHGDVTVVETPGGGATFRVTLPAIQPGVTPIPASPLEH